MTSRPVFIPSTRSGELVIERDVMFTWNGGLAPSQKSKNIAALHAAAARIGIAPLLEVSTKSPVPAGKELSAFNLHISVGRDRTVPLEVAYQASKRFTNGGPYMDLLTTEPREARRDPRLRESGDLIGFVFAGMAFPLEPATAFYDWLYIRALQRVPAIFAQIVAYVGFTDIEFNPMKSVNCQARSCAAALTLNQRGVLEDAARSFGFFVREMGHASPSDAFPHQSRQMELPL